MAVDHNWNHERPVGLPQLPPTDYRQTTQIGHFPCAVFAWQAFANDDLNPELDKGN